MSTKPSLFFVYHVEQDSLLPQDVIACIRGISLAIEEAHKALFPNKIPLIVRLKPFEKGYKGFVFELCNDTKMDSLFPHSSEQDMKLVLQFLGLLRGNLPVTLPSLFEQGFSLKRNKQGCIVALLVKGFDDVIHPALLSFFAHASSSLLHHLRKGLLVADSPSFGYLLHEQKETKMFFDNSSKQVFNKGKRFLKSLESDALENESIKWLSPHKGSYGGDHYTYQFSVSGSSRAIIYAKILDEGFLSDVENADIRLHSSDRIKVRLREIQIKEKKKIKVKYEIIEVLEYEEGLSPVKQMSLFD